MDKEFLMKKQTVYDNTRLYNFMSIAPKLLNCQASMSYFVKNYEVFMTYFKSSQAARKPQQIVHATIVIFIFWNILICDVNKKVQVKGTFNLNRDLATESFFRDLF